MTNVATLLTDTVAAHPDRLTIRLSDDVLTCAERYEASAAPSRPGCAPAGAGWRHQPATPEPSEVDVHGEADAVRSFPHRPAHPRSGAGQGARRETGRPHRIHATHPHGSTRLSSCS
jgi:hypothetical protein